MLQQIKGGGALMLVQTFHFIRLLKSFSPPCSQPSTHIIITIYNYRPQDQNYTEMDLLAKTPSKPLSSVFKTIDQSLEFSLEVENLIINLGLACLC